jgi:uncharacterized protein (TIGR00661 family)
MTGRLRIMFAVQGDGRGHMTQALALQRMLLDAGHKISSVLINRADLNGVPAFFRDQIQAPIVGFDSLEFVADRANKGIMPIRSVWHNVQRAPALARSTAAITSAFRQERPDLLVNLFEPLVGLTRLFSASRLPMVGIGHQYLLLHPRFEFPPGKLVDRFAIRHYIRMTTIGARRLLALSFDHLPDLPGAKIAVVPPLLRPEVLAQPLDRRDDFLLVYLLKAGLREEILAWHARHPDVPIHCFTDQPQAEAAVAHDATLTFHRLGGSTFLDLMARCRGLVCTAGFESVCEAMYLGKPVLMVPTPNHFEQACNALDGQRAGAGIASDRFDIDRFVAYLPTHRTDPEPYRHWVRSAPERFIRLIELAAARQRS